MLTRELSSIGLTASVLPEILRTGKTRAQNKNSTSDPNFLDVPSFNRSRVESEELDRRLVQEVGDNESFMYDEPMDQPPLPTLRTSEDNYMDPAMLEEKYEDLKLKIYKYRDETPDIQGWPELITPKYEELNKQLSDLLVKLALINDGFERLKVAADKDTLLQTELKEIKLSLFSQVFTAKTLLPPIDSRSPSINGASTPVPSAPLTNAPAAPLPDDVFTFNPNTIAEILSTLIDVR